MSKWMIFTKDNSTDEYTVSFIPENDMEAKVMISELGRLDLNKYLFVEVADNIDPELLKEGTTLNKEIFKSHLECMGIDPLAFASAFSTYYVMSTEESHNWVDGVRNA